MVVNFLKNVDFRFPLAFGFQCWPFRRFLSRRVETGWSRYPKSRLIVGKLPKVASPSRWRHSWWWFVLQTVDIVEKLIHIQVRSSQNISTNLLSTATTNDYRVRGHQLKLKIHAAVSELGRHRVHWEPQLYRTALKFDRRLLADCHDPRWWNFLVLSIWTVVFWKTVFAEQKWPVKWSFSLLTVVISYLTYSGSIGFSNSQCRFTFKNPFFFELLQSHMIISTALMTWRQARRVPIEILIFRVLRVRVG